MDIRTLPEPALKRPQQSTQRLIVVSNRLPIAATRAEDDTWSLLPGSGGLITALAPALEAVQLADGALLVNPYDILGTAAAIEKACEMPLEERKRRMIRLQRNIQAEDVHHWVDDFLDQARDDTGD